MKQRKEREPDVRGDRQATPDPKKETDQSAPLTPIQQAAYSAAIFGNKTGEAADACPAENEELQ